MFRGNLAHTGVYNAPGVPKFSKIKWKFQTGGQVISSPAVTNGAAYIASTDGNLYALDLESGARQQVLGLEAHLGAGVILSNVKLDHAEIAVSTPEGDIPTGLRKFGAIVGDRTEIGCNSVIDPGSVIGRDCMIYPSVNFRGFLPHGSRVKLRQDLQVIGKR